MNFPIIPTVTELRDAMDNVCNDVIDAIKWCQISLYVKYPERPSKPVLQSKHTVEDVKAYANKLDAYDVDMVDYTYDKHQIQDHNTAVGILVEDYIKVEARLHRVPKQYQDKVYSFAYQKSHGDGYYAVYCTLCELVEIFE